MMWLAVSDRTERSECGLYTISWVLEAAEWVAVATYIPGRSRFGQGPAPVHLGSYRTNHDGAGIDQARGACDRHQLSNR
jgi:hypothetical protein